MTEFHALWVGPSLSLVERACLASFVQHGHRVTLHCYDTVAGVPPGVVVADADATVPRARLVRNRRGRGRGSYAAFSDAFRYACLWQHGGCYVDCDVLCLAARFPQRPLLVGREDAQRVCGAVLGLEAGSALAREALFEALSFGLERVRWSEIGPRLVTRLIAEHGLDASVLPPRAFYPIHHTDWLDPLLPSARRSVERRVEGAYACHLWNEKLRRAGLDKNVLPPRGSWLRARFAAALPDAGDGPEYTVVHEDRWGAVLGVGRREFSAWRREPRWLERPLAWARRTAVGVGR